MASKPTIYIDQRILEDATDEELAELITTREMWNSACRRFMTADDAEDPKLKKLEHRATFWWLQSVDHCLRLYTGLGLEQFATEGSPWAVGDYNAIKANPRYQADACLTISSDQCSVGLSALTFADQVLKLRVEGIADCPHRRWNNEKNGLTDAKAWDVVLLFSVFFNVGFGPWLSGSWQGTMDGARKEMSTIASQQCPLFQTTLPLIVADKGQESRLYDQQWQQKVWQEICDDHGPLAQKGPRMSLRRWYGWWDCFDYWLPYLHQRLLVMLYWAISTKVITGDVQSVRMKLSGLTHAHTEKDGKETMEEAKAKQAAVRAKGKNQLHVATLIAMNEAVVRRGKCIYFLLTPMRTAHGEQIKQCHDSESSVAWYCRQAGGAIWEPIEETWQLLEKPGPLGKMGFSCSASQVAKWSLDSCAVQDEDFRTCSCTRPLPHFNKNAASTFIQQFSLCRSGCVGGEFQEHRLVTTTNYIFKFSGSVGPLDLHDGPALEQVQGSAYALAQHWPRQIGRTAVRHRGRGGRSSAVVERVPHSPRGSQRLALATGAEHGPAPLASQALHLPDRAGAGL